MASEMLTRVARAICKETGNRALGCCGGIATDCEHEWALPVARAALQALREPTMDMCEIGCSVMTTANESPHRLGGAGAVFRAMIDAAEHGTGRQPVQEEQE